MDAREFFPIAERYKRSTVEAERRTSAGRSYYALFNATLMKLSQQGVLFRGTPDEHHKLIAYLSKARSQTAATVSEALKHLRRERNVADYHLKAVFNASRSEIAYEIAIDAIMQFDAIPAVEMASIVRNIQALP